MSREGTDMAMNMLFCAHMIRMMTKASGSRMVMTMLMHVMHVLMIRTNMPNTEGNNRTLCDANSRMKTSLNAFRYGCTRNIFCVFQDERLASTHCMQK
eukprot:3986343-Amphidinium_carterae.1